jgi:hypothetical protein
MVLGSPLTEFNARKVSFFVTKLSCGRHDSTSFGEGGRYLLKSWPYQPLPWLAAHLPASTIIALPGKMPDMVYIAKLVLGGGQNRVVEKTRRYRRKGVGKITLFKPTFDKIQKKVNRIPDQMILTLDGKVVRSSFEQCHRYSPIPRIA